MNEFEITTQLKLFNIIIIASLLVKAVLLAICFWKSSISKPTKSVELNEEQFFDNIERAKKGEEADVNKGNFAMSNV